jgi:hypothetical protein
MAHFKVAIPVAALGALALCAIGKALPGEWGYVAAAILALMIVLWPRSAR